MPKGLETHTLEFAASQLMQDEPVHTQTRRKRGVRKTGVAATLAAGLMLSGCASPIIGALTIGEIATIAGAVSTFMSGQDLTEHALSAATGQDCRILESLLRSERDFCVDHNDSATDDDFEGVAALFSSDPGTAVAQADTRDSQALDADLIALGFAPIDRSVARNRFSLETAQARPEGQTRQPVSFGMLQASYGQSWSYELTTHRDGTRSAQAGVNRQVASADPQALPGTRTDGTVIVPTPVTN